MSTSDKQNEWKEREIGALWKRVSKSGKSTFCTGYITSDELGREVKQRVVMFANKGKQTDRHPDYIIYISNEEEAAPAASAAQAAPAPTPRRTKTRTEPSISIDNLAPEPEDNSDSDDGIPM